MIDKMARIKIVFAIVVFFFLLILPSIVLSSGGTDVIATVKTRLIELVVHPERRIPAVGNWDTVIQFELRNCLNSQTLFAYNNISTNTSGSGTINVPDVDLISPDNYAFAVKGFSHLTKEFNCQIFADNINEFIDFTGEGELLAGDTSNISDDSINSLDLSSIALRLFTADLKNDLNQDGEVNSLDLSNMAYNIFMEGD